MPEDAKFFTILRSSCPKYVPVPEGFTVYEDYGPAAKSSIEVSWAGGRLREVGEGRGSWEGVRCGGAGEEGWGEAAVEEGEAAVEDAGEKMGRLGTELGESWEAAGGGRQGETGERLTAGMAQEERRVGRLGVVLSARLVGEAGRGLVYRSGLLATRGG